jgi:hypothetical protein
MDIALLFVVTACTAGVQFSARAKDFSLLYSVQTGSGAHPASHKIGTGGSFPTGAKQPGHEDDHLHPSSVVVKNAS